MTLRFASLRDDHELAAIYAPIVESTTISFETIAPNAAEMRARIAGHPPNKPWIVAERDGAVAGYAYASSFRDRVAYRFGAEVTVYVAEAARRGGVGGALYQALTHLLVSQGYRRAFAGITLPNDASIALHRAAGFTEAGVVHAAGFKFDRWHDVAFYERALGAFDVPERELLNVDELDVGAVKAAFAVESQI